VKIEKVIRRVSADGTSVLNAAVAVNIGEPGGSTEAGATSVQDAEIVQRSTRNAARPRPSHKES
jgi:hypothetical protein